MNQAWIQLLPQSLRSKLSGRYTLQKIISNTGWLFADRILRMGVGLIVGVWIARYLGPEQFGLFNYAIAFVALLTPLATLGLDGIIVRDIVRDPSCKDKTLGTAFVLKLLGSLIALLLGLVIITLLRPNDTSIHWLIGIVATGIIFQAFDVIDFWFQSQVQSKYTVYAKNLAFALIALVKVGLIYAKAPLIAFAWAGLAEMALGAVGLIIAYQISGNYLPIWQLNLSRAKTLLKDSWSLILSGVAIMIYMKIDQLMLGEIVGDKAVGIYSAATRLSEVWYFIPAAIVTSVSPAIIQAKQVDKELYHSLLQQLFNVLIVLAFAIAIPISVLAKPIVVTLYGKTYLESVPVLITYIWSAPFVFLGVASSTWLTVEGLFTSSLVTTIVGGISNIVFNLFLIPRYGSLGAAVATLLSYGIASYLLNCFIFRKYPIFKMQTRALSLIFIGELWKNQESKTTK